MLDALDLLKVLALGRNYVPSLVAQQALVVLVAWQRVYVAPERCPAPEAAQAHVCGNQAGGGADDHCSVKPESTGPQWSSSRI